MRRQHACSRPACHQSAGRNVDIIARRTGVSRSCDALGSCVFNLVLLVFLDAMHRKAPMYSRMDPRHILTAGFGIILIGVTGTVGAIANATWNATGVRARRFPIRIEDQLG